MRGSSRSSYHIFCHSPFREIVHLFIILGADRLISLVRFVKFHLLRVPEQCGVVFDVHLATTATRDLSRRPSWSSGSFISRSFFLFLRALDTRPCRKTRIPPPSKGCYNLYVFLGCRNSPIWFSLERQRLLGSLIQSGNENRSRPTFCFSETPSCSPNKAGSSLTNEQLEKSGFGIT